MKTNTKDQRIGITFSTFDLFHAGHVKMIEEAKRQCDYLIVGLQLDPSLDRKEKNSPSQSIIERYIQLRGSKDIDEVVPYVSEQDKDFTGKAYCEAKGIEMYYNNRDHRFSSSGLRKQVQYANLKKKDA
jgi:glycerol-3-phosphate cytidylyltransferase